ncbi:MAG TPA: PTS sugar transporter subunit IIA [Novosphingobium sp.]|nr:PTS sugar transporter subunit IIA [Novosphingobium sp.]
MNALFQLLPEAVGIVQAGSKDMILDQLADRFASVYELDHTPVLAAIRQREAVGSTGFGRGIAIPHARITGINRPVAVFFRLARPVDFAAADGMPVRFVFGLLSPENSGSAHLHALAAISRMMRDDRMAQALAEAPNPEALFGLLTNVSDRDAA